MSRLKWRPEIVLHKSGNEKEWDTRLGNMREGIGIFFVCKGSAPYLHALRGVYSFGKRGRGDNQKDGAFAVPVHDGFVKFSECEASSSSSSSSFLFSHHQLIKVHKQGEMCSLMSKFFHQKRLGLPLSFFSPSFLTPHPHSLALGSWLLSGKTASGVQFCSASCGLGPNKWTILIPLSPVFTCLPVRLHCFWPRPLSSTSHGGWFSPPRCYTYANLTHWFGERLLC